MRAALATAVVLAVAAPAAASSRVQTYAYVSAADPDWESVEGGDHCDFTLLVPRTSLDAAPSAPTDPRMQGATTATAHEDDPDRTCFGYLHTWVRASFDPADRAHAHVHVSRSLRWILEDYSTWVIGIEVALIVLLVILERAIRRARGI